MSKTCTKCNKNKDLNQFSKDNAKKDGLYSSCTECRTAHNNSDSAKKIKKEWRINNKPLMREKNYKKSYGMSIDDYNVLFEKQNGKCAICGSVETKRKASNFFAVDHCHKTGKVRGLLCDRCNVGIGSLEDSYDIVLSAANYLRKSMEEQNE